MILRYRPTDGPAVEFKFNPGDMPSPESESVEEVGGNTWSTFEEWGALFFRGSMKARRAALWVFLRRTNPRLQFEEVSFTPSQVDVDYSHEEKNRILEVMLADPAMDEVQRAHLTRMIDTDLVSDVEVALDDAGVERDGRFPKDQPD